MAYAIVIEQSGDAPKLIITSTKAVADKMRETLEAATDGRWDDDPDWHNYPRQPIKVSNYDAEMQRILQEVSNYDAYSRR